MGATYFVAVSALTGTYDHVGPAGISLLQAALVRRASARCAERTPVVLAHLRACHLLFLTLTVSKGVATLASAEAKSDHQNSHDHHERDPSSSSSSLMARVGGGVAFANLLVLAFLGYLTYVAFLCFSRLERWCLVVLLERRWEKVFPTSAPSSRATAAETSERV